MKHPFSTFLAVCCVMLAVTPALAQEQTPPAERQPGEIRTDEHGIEQVWVPAGCFLMGTSPDQAEAALALDPPSFGRAELPSEQPQHEVCLTQGFWLDRTEVTQASFQAFIDDGGYTNESLWSDDGWDWLARQPVDSLPDDCVEQQPDWPQVCITWYEAEAYANWRGGLLPTEAQWEYAARGPDSRVYPWGDTWDPALANVEPASGVSLMPVGSYPDGASWVGALDMAGNAMEWVNTWFAPRYYQDSPRDDPPGPESGQRRIEKGGWWGSHPFVARSAFHLYEDPPTYQDHHIGARIITVEAAEGAAR